MSLKVATTLARKLISEYQAKHDPDANKLVLIRHSESIPNDLHGGLYLVLADIDSECTKICK